MNGCESRSEKELHDLHGSQGPLDTVGDTVAES